jgi:hypothetical protein
MQFFAMRDETLGMDPAIWDFELKAQRKERYECFHPIHIMHALHDMYNVHVYF